MLAVIGRRKTTGLRCKYVECLPSESQCQVHCPQPSRVTDPHTTVIPVHLWYSLFYVCSEDHLTFVVSFTDLMFRVMFIFLCCTVHGAFTFLLVSAQFDVDSDGFTWSLTLQLQLLVLLLAAMDCWNCNNQFCGKYPLSSQPLRLCYAYSYELSQHLMTWVMMLITMMMSCIVLAIIGSFYAALPLGDHIAHRTSSICLFWLSL